MKIHLEYPVYRVSGDSIAWMVLIQFQSWSNRKLVKWNGDAFIKRFHKSDFLSHFQDSHIFMVLWKMRNDRESDFLNIYIVYTYLNVSHCFSQFIKSLLRQSQKSRIDNELIPRSRKMANNSSENPGGNIISFAWSKLQFIMDMTNGFSVQCTKVPPRCAHSSSSIWLVFQKPVLYFIFSVAEFFSLSSFKI